ncbi:uncharacterized protein BP01DRAFT_386787 [Aspergillus saccharolyticus JOP 1030-1]|uniref:Uncharacterized protein n=1 Tax=Aspergillus saccharolyticus JOP 1030-1 TaxID=1450539 RepID=A0A318Z2B8_9EURO|nr:hypothetical protein BP01DRAFT_386787 [Aspergillus saccharolyticus JOP 1030-1]PYH41099.1 hypothetical protein BP01DRAFT_386787 [Aspergillus saccharolyticus JOP 1030-1]
MPMLKATLAKTAISAPSPTAWTPPAQAMHVIPRGSSGRYPRRKLNSSEADVTKEPPEEQTFTSHAVSTSAIFQIKEGNVQASGFSDAARIVAQRQEIVIGNMAKRAVVPSPTFRSMDWSLEPAPDSTWTYCKIAHAARVTNSAYGEGSQNQSK